MKKSSWRKLMALLLAGTIGVGMLGCGAEKDSETKVSSGVADKQTDVAEGSTDITFPLEEEMTFEIMVKYDGDIETELEKCGWWQELYEQTNVKINFTTIGSENFLGTLNAMFTANQEGDAVLSGGVISDGDLIAMAYNGLFQPLNDYVTNEELMPNFNQRVLAESPSTIQVMAAPDGNIYSLCTYDGLHGAYVESPIWINKNWLQALGKTVEDIKTIDDLKEVLVAFRDNDMNGNGDKTDEIPYLFRTGHAFSHMEAILGLWGIATKDNALDNYVYVKDGKVIFAPTSQAYKDALITLNDWYEEDLIWSECFTGTNETYTSLINSETTLVGMYTAKTVQGSKIDEYVLLEPVTVEGYEPNWYIHPGYLGSKGMLSVTRSCENVDVLMAWADCLYALENSIGLRYDTEEAGRYFFNAEGKMEQSVLEQEALAKIDETSRTFYSLSSSLPWAFTAKDYEDSIVLTGTYGIYASNYDTYEEYLTDEPWPRPYPTAETTARLSELRTDIFNTIAVKRAAWVTGEADINAEWDNYVKSLEVMGLEEFVNIMQSTYDLYMQAMK